MSDLLSAASFFFSGFQIFPSGTNSRSTTSPGTLLRERSWQDPKRLVDQSSLVPRPVGLLPMQRTSGSCPNRKIRMADESPSAKTIKSKK
nr:hypothetical protein [uncultured Ruegeria sp.]